VKKYLALLVLAAVAGAAAAQEMKTNPEHVTAPGLPGQANKDIVIRPSGTLKDVGWGIVQQGDAPAARLGRDPGRNASLPPADPGITATYVPPRQTGPQGPAIVNAAYLTVRGNVARYEKGVAVTVVDARTGRERRVPLAKNASVYEGIKAGDAVAVRIPFDEGSDARTADRVEAQKALAAPAGSSKFSQAQAAPR
jgi:hypothetical protein